MVSRNSVVFALAFCAFAAATDVQQCPGMSIDGLSDAVRLTPCKTPPCKLKKGTNQHISIYFMPKNDIIDVQNSVTAEVFGLNVPFVGVDGKSICDKVFTESGEQTTCPLKAGVKYIYKDSFPILQFYPSIALKVHWDLHDNKNNMITCFEVPARIT